MATFHALTQCRSAASKAQREQQQQLWQQQQEQQRHQQRGNIWGSSNCSNNNGQSTTKEEGQIFNKLTRTLTRAEAITAINDSSRNNSENVGIEYFPAATLS